MGSEYLDNFQTFVESETQGDNIDYQLLHYVGTKEIFHTIGLNNTIQAIQGGGNSMIFTYQNNSRKHFLKIAHSINQTTEVSADNLILESVMNHLFKYIDPRRQILSGVDKFWSLPNVVANQFTTMYRRPPASFSLYNIGFIENPILNASSLTKVIHTNQKFDSSIGLPYENFILFIRQLVYLGNTYGFTHNDLHPGNILFDNQTATYRMIDLGRAYATIIPQDILTKLLYVCRNELLKLSNNSPSTLEELKKIEVPDLSTFIYSIYPELSNGEGWMKPLPKDDFQKKTYILFDLLTLYKGLGFFVDIDERYEQLLLNIPSKGSCIGRCTNKTVSTIPQTYLSILDKTALGISSLDPLDHDSMHGKLVSLLRVWYEHYIVTFINIYRYVIENDIHKYQEYLFHGGQKSISIWLKTDIFAMIYSQFYKMIDSSTKQKIETILDKVSYNSPIITGGKKLSLKKGGMDIETEGYGEALLASSEARAALAKVGRTNLPYPTDYPYNSSENIRWPSVMQQTVSVSGGKQSEIVFYENKKRKVYIDKNKKYIIFQKEKVYLSDIRGKYRYI